MRSARFVALSTSVTALLGLTIAMIAPLFIVADKYDVHLFPKRDAIPYTPGRTHIHSENLHIAACVVLAMSTVFTAVSVAREASQRGVGGVLSAAALAVYVAAVATLIDVGLHVRDGFRDLPIPLPDVHVKAGAGGIADGIGFFACLVAFLANVYDEIFGRRSAYAQLS
jgi:hypothetical protein